MKLANIKDSKTTITGIITLIVGLGAVVLPSIFTENAQTYFTENTEVIASGVAHLIAGVALLLSKS